MRKVVMHSVMIVIALATMTACYEDDNLQNIASQETEGKIKTEKNFAMRAYTPRGNNGADDGNLSTCTFPNEGDDMGYAWNGVFGTMHDYLPRARGKYCVTLSTTNDYASTARLCINLEEITDGKLIVRVVGEKKAHWWGGATYKVLDDCSSISRAGYISTDAIGDEVENFDNIYYEYIVLSNNPMTMHCTFVKD